MEFDKLLQKIIPNCHRLGYPNHCQPCKMPKQDLIKIKL